MDMIRFQHALIYVTEARFQNRSWRGSFAFVRASGKATDMAKICAVLMTLAVLLLLAPTIALSACAGHDLAQGWDTDFAARVSARAAATPFGEGRMYEVQRDGAASTLFGTLHLTDDDVATPPDALIDRLANARQLMVEVTREEEKRMMRKIILNPGLFLAKDSARLQRSLSVAEWRDLVRMLKPYGIPEPYANQVAPWYLAITLTIPACAQADVASGRLILDRRIEAAAKERGIPVTGLEIPEEVFSLFSDLPYDDQVAMLRASLPTAWLAEDMLATTKRMYKNGQIAQIEAFSLALLEQVDDPKASQAADKFLELLLVERNRRWMDQLVPALDEGGLVVAVGALHLTGEDGLLAQLQALGFKVTRLDL